MEPKEYHHKILPLGPVLSQLTEPVYLISNLTLPFSLRLECVTDISFLS